MIALPRLRACGAPLGTTAGAPAASARNDSWARLTSTVLVRRIRARRVRKLIVERLAISHAPAQELRPRRHDRQRIRAFRQQGPQRRMVPAERVTRTVAV